MQGGRDNILTCYTAERGRDNTLTCYTAACREGYLQADAGGHGGAGLGLVVQLQVADEELVDAAGVARRQVVQLTLGGRGDKVQGKHF